MKNLIQSVILGLGFIAVPVGVVWGVAEIQAHYQERQYLFEWELQNRTISAVLDSVGLMIERIKQ